MDISIYFEKLTLPSDFKKGTLGDYTTFYSGDVFPDLEDVNIAILGVEEERGTTNKGCAKSPNVIRKELYDLYTPDEELKLIDLGNIMAGATKEDTYFAVRDAVEQLIKKNIFVIILGGSQD